MSNEARKLGFLIWGGLAALILLIFIAFATSVLKEKPAAKPFPVLKQLPDFALTNQFGKPTTLADLRGKVWIADIIFTRCAGPCPRMTKQFSQLQNDLVGEPSVHFLTLTADAEFDTPEVLKKYGDRFNANHDRWLFLTGDQRELYRLATQDGLLLAVQEIDPNQRTSEADLFVHSTIFVLVDKQGRVRAVYESSELETHAKIVADARRLAKE